MFSYSTEQPMTYVEPQGCKIKDSNYFTSVHMVSFLKFGHIAMLQLCYVAKQSCNMYTVINLGKYLAYTQTHIYRCDLPLKKPMHSLHL